MNDEFMIAVDGEYGNVGDFLLKVDFDPGAGPLELSVLPSEAGILKLGISGANFSGGVVESSTNLIQWSSFAPVQTNTIQLDVSIQSVGSTFFRIAIPH
jgi:hypothetical protein